MNNVGQKVQFLLSRFTLIGKFLQLDKLKCYSQLTN